MMPHHRREDPMLDPQAKALLDAMPAMPDFDDVDLAALRAGMQAQSTLSPGEPEPVARVRNQVLPRPDREIPVRIYTPEGAGPFPALVYFHGGGFVLCDLDTHDGTCRSLANGAGCVVVSVDYRLAPEHPFPAGPEDCYAAVRWVAEHAAALDVDPSRIAVGGDSAGGNLTAAVMKWFWRQYLADPSHAERPFASPLRAPDLRGLPPAHVVTAGHDPLRDEGEAYAARLREAGVAVTARRHDGMFHGFFAMTAFLDAARQAMDEACEELRNALA
jgi:acetyl esterase